MAPELLIKKKKEAMTDVGNLNVVSFGLTPKSENPNRIYQLIIIDYPEGTFHPDSIDLKEETIDQFIFQSAQEEHSELIYEEEIFTNGMQMRQWRIHNNEELSIKSRLAITGDRVYILQVMSDITKSLNEDIDKFLDSFVKLN